MGLRGAVGKVNNMGSEYIGMLVHGVFNASISLPPDEQFEQFEIGSDVPFVVKYVSTKGRIIYVEGRVATPEEVEMTANNFARAEEDLALPMSRKIELVGHSGLALNKDGTEKKKKKKKKAADDAADVDADADADADADPTTDTPKKKKKKKSKAADDADADPAETPKKKKKKKSKAADDADADAAETPKKKKKDGKKRKRDEDD